MEQDVAKQPDSTSEHVPTDAELSDEQLDEVAGGASHPGGANFLMGDGSVR
jgi:prepilin-type processing-associated H-X9-DG protein